ncbi:putative nucleotidyltransferase with HDIG domain [Deinococcus sp. HSC-46F16]|uniref:HD domain-containing phosphohydrolase n=1 Tax=Deinococcus sp. HSC-46F16 TaxID=2910968 RepID=UPI00209DE385|nr:putative nucleotidyltransferase with HDIG domain [Deinococcus sp. HSC-46F16]
MSVDDRAALRVMLDLSRSLLAAASGAEVEATLTRQSVTLLGTRSAAFLRYLPGADVLRVTAEAGAYAGDLGLTLTRGQGASWRAALAEDPLLHLRRDETPPWIVRAPGVPPTHSLFAPLRSSSGRLLGVLTVGREDPPFSPRDEELLVTFANAGTVTLQRTYETARAAATREGALLALGLALEARDYETQGHTGRTVALSMRLGRALGLDESAQDHLRQGAYLHDIGKLSVPDDILLKPGPLTPEERRQMQRHVLTGEALVRRIPTMPPEVLEVVRSHHERWDGAGYPDGLAGEAIPALARVFSVIDVFDALTHQRPYRAPLSVPGALALIRAEAGRQFDPRVVGAFLTLFAQGTGSGAGPEAVRGQGCL